MCHAIFFSLGTCIKHLCAKFHMLSFTDSLIIAMKHKAKYRITWSHVIVLRGKQNSIIFLAKITIFWTTDASQGFMALC
jgi:hypothetical protein